MSLTDAFKGEQPKPLGSKTNGAKVISGSKRLREYAKAALAGRCATLASTPEGTRNATLNESALIMAHMVCSGWIGESTVRDDLLAAAKRAGLGESESTKTFESGFNAGINEPAKEPPDNVKDDHRVQEEQRRQEHPTTSDPLRGLKHLSKVAVVGRARFVTLASEPVNYVWQDIAVAGTIASIAGAPSGGKTTLLFLVLAARMNIGEPIGLLGRIVTPAPKGQFTVLIEGEHGEASAARKIIRSFDLLGLDHAGLDRLILVARKAVRLDSPEWGDVVRLIEVGLVSDIAIDTVARVAPANPDSEQEQVAIFDLVARAIDKAPEDLKPTAWPVMHTRKNGTGGLEDVSGSAQRTGQADTVMMLRADKSNGKVASVEVVFEKLREAPDDFPEPVTFTITRAADGSHVLDQGVSPQADKDRPIEARIIDVLKVRPRTKSELSDVLKRSRKDIDEALTVLFEGKHIRTTTIKRQGQPRKAFELSTQQPIPDEIPDSRFST